MVGQRGDLLLLPYAREPRSRASLATMMANVRLLRTSVTDVEATDLEFETLPFEYVSPGNGEPVANRWPQYPVGLARLIAGVDFCCRHGVQVLNLSLGGPGEFDPTDPVSLALAFAIEQERAVVVVAAGNNGPKQGSMQRLARAPWVIAVGATDRDGHLLTSSSRGLSGRYQPCVVADGTHVEATGGSGTSYAAQRVSQLAAALNSLMYFSLRGFKLAQGEWALLSHGIPVPTLGILDTGETHGLLLPPDPHRLGVADHLSIGNAPSERTWYSELFERIRAGAWSVAPDPGIVRRLLQLAARPVAGAGREDVGAGRISHESVIEMLASLTPSKWLQAFIPEAFETLAAEEIAGLDRRLGPLWEPARAEGILHVIWTSLLIAEVKVHPGSHPTINSVFPGFEWADMATDPGTGRVDVTNHVWPADA